MKSTRIFAVLLLLTFLFVNVSISTAQSSPNPSALPPDGKVQGLTLGDWAVEDWKALLAIPASQNPIIGNPWTTCYLERIGNVGLGVSYGFTGSSECEMPVGMTLYVLVVGSECSTIESPPFYGGNEAELRACALQFAPANLAASVDGVPVRNIEAYTTLSPMFQFYVPPDNILGAPEGTYDSIAYQTAFLLAPLSPGEHTIHVHGEIPNFSFTYDWIYHITVTE